LGIFLTVLHSSLETLSLSRCRIMSIDLGINSKSKCRVPCIQSSNNNSNSIPLLSRGGVHICTSTTSKSARRRFSHCLGQIEGIDVGSARVSRHTFTRGCHASGRSKSLILILGGSFIPPQFYYFRCPITTNSWFQVETGRSRGAALVPSFLLGLPCLFR